MNCVMFATCHIVLKANNNCEEVSRTYGTRKHVLDNNIDMVRKENKEKIQMKAVV